MKWRFTVARVALVVTVLAGVFAIYVSAKFGAPQAAQTYAITGQLLADGPNGPQPIVHPHSIRKTLARLGEEVCNSPEEFKAWSQNLGHEQVLTTFLSYGSVAADRQGAIMRGLGATRQSKQPNAEDFADAVVRRLQSAGARVPATP
jgi:hypothetical protein